MILNLLLLVVGFVLLIKGADFFVDGASSTAQNFKVSKMLIGLTIIAFGTSAPEFAVSIQSLAKGSEVKEGDKLTLYIPNLVEEFPDMAELGWSQSDAENFCNKYGLQLQVEEQETSAYAVGTIISQSRGVGSPVVKGQTLKIVVAIAPKEPKPETNTETNSEDNE